MGTESISSEKYVAATTYRKSGDGVSTATWIVPLNDGRVGFWTSSASAKIKRLKNNPRITLQPADQRGRVKDGTSALEGTAQVVSSGPDFDAVQAAVRAKYGAMVHITKALNTIGHLGKKFPYGDTVLVITLEPAAA